MASRDIIDIFEDCTQRIASGQSIEDCLRVYPEYAAQLRPLIETQVRLRLLQLPQVEILEDQEAVWQQVEAQLPQRIKQSRRNSPPYQLLLVALLFFGLAVTMFALTRPNLPPDENPILMGTELNSETADQTQFVTLTAESTLAPSIISTATQTLFPTMTMSVTPSITSSPTNSPTAIFTPTPTNSPTATFTPTQTVTPVPTSTFAPGCGAPLTVDDAIARVLEVYPNTTVISAKQVIKFGGTRVWEIETSHQIDMNIDVACGYILTIERVNDAQTNGNAFNEASGSNNNNPDTSDVNSNETNNGAVISGSGSSGLNNNNDDDSGSGSNDNNDDDDDSGSGSTDNNDDDDD